MHYTSETLTHCLINDGYALMPLARKSSSNVLNIESRDTMMSIFICERYLLLFHLFWVKSHSSHRIR